MTDYTELVKALTCGNDGKLPCHNNECPYWVDQWHGIGLCNVIKKDADAADAIEALQAELEKKRTADCWGCKCEKLEPKRGEWVEDTTTYYAGPGRSNYKCSLCGKICGTWRRGLKPSELPNWCGNCGADMRANMEVQDGQ